MSHRQLLRGFFRRLWLRKRLLLSFVLFLLGLGSLILSIATSLNGLSGGGLESLFNLLVYMAVGYAALILSQLFLYSEVWWLGSHLLIDAAVKKALSQDEE